MLSNLALWLFSLVWPSQRSLTNFWNTSWIWPFYAFCPSFCCISSFYTSFLPRITGGGCVTIWWIHFNYHSLCLLISYFTLLLYFLFCPCIQVPYVQCVVGWRLFNDNDDSFILNIINFHHVFWQLIKSIQYWYFFLLGLHCRPDQAGLPFLIWIPASCPV